MQHRGKGEGSTLLLSVCYSFGSTVQMGLQERLFFYLFCAEPLLLLDLQTVENTLAVQLWTGMWHCAVLCVVASVSLELFRDMMQWNLVDFCRNYCLHLRAQKNSSLTGDSRFLPNTGSYLPHTVLVTGWGTLRLYIYRYENLRCSTVHVCVFLGAFTMVLLN